MKVGRKAVDYGMKRLSMKKIWPADGTEQDQNLSRKDKNDKGTSVLDAFSTAS